MKKSKKVILITVIIVIIILIYIIIGILFKSNKLEKRWKTADPTDITAINCKFSKYEGITKGSVIKSLINDVISYNKLEDEVYRNNIILEGGEGINNIEIDGIQTIEVTSIKNTKIYIVNINEYYDNGQVKKIYIEEVQEEKNKKGEQCLQITQK